MAMSSIHTLYAFSFRLCFPNSSPQFKPLNAIPLRRTKHYNNNNNNVKFPRERTRTRATLDDVETDQLSSIPLVENEKAKKDVEESVKVLKDAAKTRKVAAEEILSALSIIEKAKVDPSAFFETLGGKESPGRTWMLIFTAEKQLKGGRYFPLTAVQRFDAALEKQGRS
uniref:Plastid lipid-associated protein/fibrillin conserved domain-containing protein n=1 Tax=Glycine max TaxID=3847 RepID=A0A0R0K136_SOYBN